MEGPSRMSAEPSSNLGMLVDGVVVENGVNELTGRDVALDRVEEADEFLVTMTLHVAPDDRTVEHVERGEQGCRSVALVVMGHRPAPSPACP